MLQQSGEWAPKPPPRKPLASEASPWVVLVRLARERWREYAWRYTIALALMGIASGATALSAWLMKDVVNDIFVNRDQRAMKWLPIALVAIFVLKGAASYLQARWLSRICNRPVADYPT